MSRSGYSDDDWDCGDNSLHLYRASVDRAIAGKRGQAFLRSMAYVMDAMPQKRLASSEWVAGESACALGVVAEFRGLRKEFSQFDPEDGDAPISAAHLLGIAESMAREIVYMNDEGTHRPETDEERWSRMRSWVNSRIRIT